MGSTDKINGGSAGVKTQKIFPNLNKWKSKFVYPCFWADDRSDLKKAKKREVRLQGRIKRPRN
jgi:hypothetical protein